MGKEAVTTADIKFVITRHLGVLSGVGKGWTKELNLVSWNDRDPKYDLREWDPDHTKMTKGITLSAAELAKLKEILLGMDLSASPGSPDQAPAKKA